jgi:hypothetical protein
MVWEAVGRAGWIGEMVGLRTTLFLRVRVGRAPEVLPPTHSQHQPLPGRARHRGEKGWIDQDEMVCQQSTGPLNGRAAGPGYCLTEGERHLENIEYGEDMLYTAAIRAGWLTGAEDEIVEVPDVHITVGIASRDAQN